MKNFCALIIAFLLVLQTNLLRAEIVTDSSQITDALVINFDGVPQTNGGGIGPLRVNNDYGINIEVYGEPGSSGLFAKPGSWGLGDNGLWTDGTYVAMASDISPPESIIVTFSDGPVAAVGVFTNYDPASIPAKIAALDKDMQILEEYNLSEEAPISTPGGVDAGAFRGIKRQSNDIYHFRVTGEVPVIDDLTFFQHTTPVNVVGSFSLSEFTETGSYPVTPDPFEASFNVVIDINEVTLAENGTFSLQTVLDTIEPNPLTVGTETFTADQITIRVVRTGTEGGLEFEQINVTLGIGDGSLTARTNDFSTSYGALIDINDITLPRTINLSPITEGFNPHSMVNEPIGGGIQNATVASGSISLSVRGETVFENGFESLD